MLSPLPNLEAAAPLEEEEEEAGADGRLLGLEVISFSGSARIHATVAATTTAAAATAAATTKKCTLFIRA